MEFSYNQLKKMDVVSIKDGKNMGRVCDLTFTEDGRILGFTVTGSKGFRFTKSDLVIPFGNVVKVGQDVVLIRGDNSKSPSINGSPSAVAAPRMERSFEELE